MSDPQELGFKSPFVLLKIGHDLAEGLDETTEPLPKEMEAQTIKIAERENGGDVLLLGPDEYEDLSDKSPA